MKSRRSISHRQAAAAAPSEASHGFFPPAPPAAAGCVATHEKREETRSPILELVNLNESTTHSDVISQTRKRTHASLSRNVANTFLQSLAVRLFLLLSVLISQRPDIILEFVISIISYHSLTLNS